MLRLAKDEEDDGHVDIFTNISHLPWKQGWYKSHSFPPFGKNITFSLVFLYKTREFTTSRTAIGYRLTTVTDSTRLTTRLDCIRGMYVGIP